MNPLNYASLEASKRLVAAGIVIKTDCFWFDKGDDEWCIEVRDYWTQSDVLSAPCMAEVWRELPEGTYLHKNTFDTEAAFGVKEYSIRDESPTDALIDLLIWQRKEANHA